MKKLFALALLAIVPAWASTVTIDGKVVEANVTISTSGTTTTPTTPTPPVTPTATCQVVDSASTVPAWTAGQTSINQPIFHSSANQVVAYKLPASALVNAAGTNLGAVNLYETPPGADVQISNQPCYINAIVPLANQPATFLDCRRHGADHFSPQVSFVGPNGPDYSVYAYCRLPSPEAGTNAYYINVRQALDASYFVLYSKQ